MRYVRQRGVYRETRRALARSEGFDAGELAELQAGELRRTVWHAARTTRYYRDLFQSLGVDPDAIRCPDDLRRLPTLDKQTVLKRSEDLCATGVRSTRIYHTSGTSGTTLAVPIDDRSRQRNYAFFARALSWAGVEGARCATFAGRPVVPATQARPSTVWRWNPAMRNRLFSSYHLNDENAPAYSRALCAFAPEYIDSYPSALSSLALRFRELGLPAPRPRAVITSSETLLDSQRSLIQEVFGAVCFDQYGCTEQSVFVTQCEAGSYHVSPEYGIVEILDADGEPAETGEIVCTSFTNNAFPLLRYRMGDMATRGQIGCRCGRAFPVLRELVGRMDDLLVTPEGRQVGRLDPVFKGARHIREAQIVQRSETDVLVRVVPALGYEDGDGDAVLDELRARLGPAMRVSIETVTSIPRTSSGKFLAVINEHARGTPLPNA
jgi:phenylacetate-CoA ligase